MAFPGISVLRNIQVLIRADALTTELMEATTGSFYWQEYTAIKNEVDHSRFTFLAQQF